MVAKVESLKASSAEMTKELIDATSSQSQCKLEIKNLQAQLREKQQSLSKLEQAIQARDKSTAEFKEQQIQLIHEQKAEYMKVAEQLRAQIQSLRMERDSLEVRLK